MERKFFVSIDFDGTIANFDITDLVIQKFAKDGWQEAEELWEKGIIGSKECLTIQISLIEEKLEYILDYLKNFSIDETFIEFTDFLKKNNIPFAIVSDGFKIFIEEMLKNAGLKDIPIYANELIETEGGLKAIFPYSKENCISGVCKCNVVEKLNQGLPIIHIGDGRSDFCIAEKASYIFSKGKLTDYCTKKNIPHFPFKNFKDIQKAINLFLNFNPENYKFVIKSYF